MALRSRTTDELQQRLRATYPRAVVRARGLHGDQTEVWYVYRDGSWTATHEAGPVRPPRPFVDGGSSNICATIPRFTVCRGDAPRGRPPFRTDRAFLPPLVREVL